MKKSLILTILLVLSIALIGCTAGQKPMVEPAQPEPAIEPIVLDIVLSDDAISFTRSIDDYIDPESLENQFAFYGLADLPNKRYQFVKDDVLISFAIDQTAGNLTADNGLVIPYKIVDDKLCLAVEPLAGLLGLQIEKYQDLRIVKSAAASFNKAIINGTAYRDYGKINSEKFTEKEVSVVNVAEGFALIIVDQQPYLTSELNLTMLQSEPAAELTESVSPLVLAWDLYGNEPEQAIDQLVDVVIPKWLSLQAADGSINNLYRPDYAANVKRQGAALWVLVNNNFDPDMTAQFLADSTARQNFIDQLVAYVSQNQIGGINLDFENIYLKDSDRYVQLAAELHVATKRLNIPLSIAVTVPGGSENWSQVYDRRRLSAVSEYITLMAYDQHWENSQTSGPVAGFSWVDQNIVKMLDLVPQHKLILGVPFYTRLWYERLSSDVPNMMKVRSKSVFMSAPRRIIDENDPVRVWDETNGQYYFAYFEGDSIVKFWYDDPAAVARKAALAKKYGLAGIACWSLGFESPAVWQELKTALQD